MPREFLDTHKWCHRYSSLGNNEGHTWCTRLPLLGLGEVAGSQFSPHFVARARTTRLGVNSTCHQARSRPLNHGNNQSTKYTRFYAKNFLDKDTFYMSCHVRKLITQSYHEFTKPYHEGISEITSLSTFYALYVFIFLNLHLKTNLGL